VFEHTAGVRQRKTARLAGIVAGGAVAIGCCLAVVGCSVPSSSVAAPGFASAPPVGAGHSGGPDARTAHTARTLESAGTFSACEQRLESGPKSVPTVAIVGASYTAGVGPGKPALSWAADLARKLRWNAVIYGVSGVGYILPGAGHLGPVRRLLAAERLSSLQPALVIIQAGHDDGRMAPVAEEVQVRRTLAFIHALAPHARIALLTVFTMPSRHVSPRLVSIDKAIVTAARAADPKVIIMDPLTGHWTFARVDGGLHPSAAGDAWIAHKVGTILAAHGIYPEPRSASAPVICDRSIRGAAAASA
jgi:lysophospholipase L1-like esterase